MAVVHAQSASEASTTTTHTMPTLTGVAAGSTILVFIGCTTNDAFTIQDDVNGAYTEQTSVTLNNGTSRVRVFRFVNSAAGDLIITGGTGSSATIRWGAAVYTGASTTDPIGDTDVAAFTTTTTPTSPSVDTTRADSLIVGFIVPDAAATTIVPAGGETERQEASVRFQFQDEAAATAGSYSSAWTLGATQPGIAAILVLQPAAAAGHAGPLVNGPLIKSNFGGALVQ